MVLFSKIVTSCLDVHAQLYCKYYTHHTTWLSPDILAAICEKQRAKCAAEHSGKHDDIAQYKHLKNSLKITILFCYAKLSSDFVLQHSCGCSYLFAKLWSQIDLDCINMMCHCWNIVISVHKDLQSSPFS